MKRKENQSNINPKREDPKINYIVDPKEQRSKKNYIADKKNWRNKNKSNYHYFFGTVKFILIHI